MLISEPMNPRFDPTAREIVTLCRRLNEKNLLSAADGNISARVSENEILITPSGLNKAFIGPGDLALIRPDGTILEGNPSGERLMHLEIYARCPEARAVVHAHPPTAIALSLARPRWTELPAGSLSELILACGRIPVVGYARPGTAAMGEVLRPFLPECRVMVLARHGGLSWGESLMEAYNGMERLEHTARILSEAERLGGAHPMPAGEVEALKELRKEMGNTTR